MIKIFIFSIHHLSMFHAFHHKFHIESNSYKSFLLPACAQGIGNCSIVISTSVARFAIAIKDWPQTTFRSDWEAFGKLHVLNWTKWPWYLISSSFVAFHRLQFVSQSDECYQLEISLHSRSVYVVMKNRIGGNLELKFLNIL